MAYELFSIMPSILSGAGHGADSRRRTGWAALLDKHTAEWHCLKFGRSIHTHTRTRMPVATRRRHYYQLFQYYCPTHAHALHSHKQARQLSSNNSFHHTKQNTTHKRQLEALNCSPVRCRRLGGLDVCGPGRTVQSLAVCRGRSGQLFTQKYTQLVTVISEFTCTVRAIGASGLV